MNETPQSLDARVVDAPCPKHGPVRTFKFRGPNFRFDEAAAYVGCLHRCGCPNAKGFYDWRVARDVIPMGKVVTKADLDAALQRDQQKKLRQLRRVS